MMNDVRLFIDWLYEIGPVPDTMTRARLLSLFESWRDRTDGTLPDAVDDGIKAERLSLEKALDPMARLDDDFDADEMVDVPDDWVEPGVATALLAGVALDAALRAEFIAERDAGAIEADVVTVGPAGVRATDPEVEGDHRGQPALPV
jgi:hypothetical protein